MGNHLLKILLILSLLVPSATAVNAQTIDIISYFASSEVKCLADNIYFESRGESVKGQKFVAHVTMNRSNHKNWPDTVCGVVKDKQGRRCQFSWYCDKQLKQLSTTMLLPVNQLYLYDEIYKMAHTIYTTSGLKDPTNGALYFHNHKVSEAVRLKFERYHKRTVKLHNHTFYK
jgi:spore germination cell wall hydrolase CwlJ-like protein